MFLMFFGISTCVCVGVHGYTQTDCFTIFFYFISFIEAMTLHRIYNLWIQNELNAIQLVCNGTVDCIASNAGERKKLQKKQQMEK